MPLGIDWPGFEALDGGLHALTAFDAAPLMERWCDILVEGNRRGVLSGRDGFDRPMPALKYRGGAGKATANRRVPDFGTTRHETTGHGPYAAGLHDNLTSWQYRQLSGPRLAPRGEASRVIKNLHTEVRHDPATDTWEAIGAWAEVVSTRGVPFLPFHFDGDGHNPRYDLRPVRPRDRELAVNALRAFVKEQFLNRF
jgi:hypothetical protein